MNQAEYAHLRAHIENNYKKTLDALENQIKVLSDEYHRDLEALQRTYEISEKVTGITSRPLVPQRIVLNLESIKKDRQGNLFQIIKTAALSVKGEFTTRMVEDAVKKLDPYIKIYRKNTVHALGKLVQTGILEMVTHRDGRQPAIYRKSERNLFSAVAG